ncbi:MAG: hypothetical protein PHF51_00075 [Candidatus ainarchaeum sp.]|nr:hypothetical protein [Candidatus ainarchaeum sp.]
MDSPDARARGQTALEFLMTYGWALAILMAVIALFVYIGLGRLPALSPNQCSLPNALSCAGYKISEGGEITLVLAQNTGYDITVTAFGCNETNATPFDLPAPVLVPNGGSANLAGLHACGKADGGWISGGEYYSGKLAVEYQEPATGISHSVTGAISYRVE